MLITIEGVDGCGKTSVAVALGKTLNAQVIHFPNDKSVTGPMIRAYLKKEWWVERQGNVHDDQMGALAFQALQMTNRMEVMPLLLNASLDEPEGPRVVLARYWQSAWVYGQLDGLDPVFLEAVHKAMAEPDFNILLDVSPRKAMSRRATRDGVLPAERYEGKLNFTTKVVDLYRDLWERHKKDYRWKIITAETDLESVVNQVIKCVERVL